MALIPERVARKRSGSTFNVAHGNGSPYREQLAHLGRILNWLSPVTPFSSEDQRLVGVAVAGGRSATLEDDEEPLGPAPREQDEPTRSD